MLIVDLQHVRLVEFGRFDSLDRNAALEGAQRRVGFKRRRRRHDRGDFTRSLQISSIAQNTRRRRYMSFLRAPSQTPQGRFFIVSERLHTNKVVGTGRPSVFCAPRLTPVSRKIA